MLLGNNKLLCDYRLLPFILDLHETSFDVTERKIVSKISRYIYMTMITRSWERIVNPNRYTGSYCCIFGCIKK